ncbi:hypothetical protein GCM10010515_44440 [Streptomyces fructofermentans]|uniref:Uncharacterized protein n=1 Tax=Streptomyces fructofermentans TaxID=152141 RepID=A0A918NI43_9ACTN|nr:hypothetical protein GCM10010515_44440 [Streptomyces fructofermentans]
MKAGCEVPAVCEVRLWEVRLNTDSFCVAAECAARGDRTGGTRPGRTRRNAEPLAWGTCGRAWGSPRSSCEVAVERPWEESQEMG